MDAKNAPYSIKKPQGWDAIIDYSKGKTKPSKEQAQKAFSELIENIKLENCVYFPDVVNAIFHRVPGKVEAENWARRCGQIILCKDAGLKSNYYRVSEPVPVELVAVKVKETH
jgi:hypothetical protein